MSGMERKRVCVAYVICTIYILISIISSFDAICKEGLREGEKICSNCTKMEKKYSCYMDKLQELVRCET